MDAHTADTHSLCNLVGGQTFNLELVDLIPVDGLLATLVDALGLSLGDTLSLRDKRAQLSLLEWAIGGEAYASIVSTIDSGHLEVNYAGDEGIT